MTDKALEIFDLTPKPPQRNLKRTESDEDLAKSIRVATEEDWTQERFDQFLALWYKTAARTDDTATNIPAESIYALVASSVALRSCLIFGDFEAVGLFLPIKPGVSAHPHLYIFSPRFLRRPSLWRSACRWAMKKWDLQRLTSLTPSTHTLAINNAKSVGFGEEARLQRDVMYNGTYHDTVVLALFREDVGLE